MVLSIIVVKCDEKVLKALIYEKNNFTKCYGPVIVAAIKIKQFKVV